MASNIFQHTDPFFADATQNPGESNDAALQLELTQTDHDDDHLSPENKLVGVVSDNPFASDARTASHGDAPNVDSEAAEPRDRTNTNTSLAVPRPSHSVAKASISTIADQDAFPESVDPLDTSLSVDPLDTSLSGGSNINHAHSEPGTDVSMRPQSSTEQSGSQQHDKFQTPAEENPRIAFTTSDHNGSVYQSNLQSDRPANSRRGTGYDFSGKSDRSCPAAFAKSPRWRARFWRTPTRQ
jgi:hypothetical protein